MKNQMKVFNRIEMIVRLGIGFLSILVFSQCVRPSRSISDKFETMRVVPYPDRQGVSYESVVRGKDTVLIEGFGPVIRIDTAQNIRVVGYINSFDIHEYMRTSYDLIFEGKVGEWYYYNSSGLLDSVVDYKKIEEIVWKVDTSFRITGEQVYTIIDSTIILSYDKKIIYSRQ